MLDYVNDRDVEVLWNSVHREIRRRGVDPQTADDLAQEAWLRTLRRSPEKGELQGWLRVVGRRLVSEMRRQGRNRRAREEEVARGEGFVDLPPSSESRLSQLVTELGEPYRTVIQARFFDGLEVAEIARRAGHSPATVRSQIHRGLSQLRVRLGIPEPRRGLPRAFLFWISRPVRGPWDLRRLLTWGTTVAAAVLGGLSAWVWLDDDGRQTPEAAPVVLAAADGVRSPVVPLPDRISTTTVPIPEVEPVPEPVRPRRAVSGRVLRSDGGGAAGATVWAGALENGAERVVGRTDVLGRYEVPAIGLDEYLWAECADGELSRRSFVGSMPGADDHDLRLLPSPGRLALTVKDADGRPVEGARAWIDGEVGGALISVVTLSGAVEIPTRSMRQGRTDARGRVSLPKPDRPRLALFVEVGGDLVAAPEFVGVDGDQTLELTLPRVGRIEGVVRGPGGAVRPGLPVELRVVNNVVRTTRSDDQGRFAFEDLPPRRYYVWTITEAPEPALSDGSEVAVAAGELSRTELSLSDEVVVSGTVLEAGEPLPGARVKLFLQRRDGTDAIFDQEVDERGSFRYPGVGLDVLRADVFVPGRELPVACSGDIAPGSGPVTLDVTPESLRLVPVTLEFPGGDTQRVPVLAAVRGRFPRVLVQAPVDPVTRRATFELPAGRYGVYAWVPGVGPWLARERLEVDVDDPADAVRRFSVPRPGRLRLHLDLPPEVRPEQVDARIRAGVFSPFGFSELGSVECLHEFESDAEGRILEVDLFPGRAGCTVDVPGYLNEERVVPIAEGDLVDEAVRLRPGREVELVVDCPVHFGIHETIELVTRAADGAERRRTVQPIAVRNELEGGRRIEMRLFVAIPLDTVELVLATPGAQGSLRWSPGDVAAAAPGSRHSLRMDLIR